MLRLFLRFAAGPDPLLSNERLHGQVWHRSLDGAESVDLEPVALGSRRADGCG